MKKQLLVLITLFFACPLMAINQPNLNEKLKESQKKPIVLFGHGRGADAQRHVMCYKHKAIGIITKDYCYSKNNLYAPQMTMDNLAQGKNFQIMQKEIQKIREEHDQNVEILYIGVSNGASTGIFFSNEFAAGIFESPYHRVDAVIENILGSTITNYIPGLTGLLHKYLTPRIVPDYNPVGNQPIDNVEKIDKEKPMFFYCSQEDDLIPASSTLKLVERLLRTGHTNVYLVYVPKGHHANIVNGEQGLYVQCLVHAFLAKYNFPHDAEKATAAKDSLKPVTLEEVEKLLRKAKK